MGYGYIEALDFGWGVIGAADVRNGWICEILISTCNVEIDPGALSQARSP